MTENKQQSSGAAKNKSVLRALTLITPLLLIAPAAGCSDKISDSPNISHGEIKTDSGAISDNANSGFIADQKVGQAKITPIIPLRSSRTYRTIPRLHIGWTAKIRRSKAMPKRIFRNISAL